MSRVNSRKCNEGGLGVNRAWEMNKIIVVSLTCVYTRNNICYWEKPASINCFRLNINGISKMKKGKILPQKQKMYGLFKYSLQLCNKTKLDLLESFRDWWNMIAGVMKYRAEMGLRIMDIDFVISACLLHFPDFLAF